jgi:2,5-dichloro-2,5-cyclohexadiene-1,4-diol dehydrogenase 1
MTQLAGKSIIITGAGSGIGAATAIRAAKAGALVTVVDVNEAGGRSVVDQIAADGGRAQFIRTDILDEEQVEAMVDGAISAFGTLHGAFNNAGIPGYSHRVGGTFTRFADFTLDAFHSGFDVNVLGTFLCMKHEIKAMLKLGGGAIVNTSSTVGILAIAGAPDYVSAKHAVIGLTKSAALDYATDNIRVNTVLPGITRTPMLEASGESNPGLMDWAAGMHPVKRLGQPLEIGEAALWLLSDAASFVTGISMPVDGGLSMV